MNLIRKLLNTIDDHRTDKWIFKEAVKGMEIYKDHYDSYPETVIDIGAHRGAVTLYSLTHGACSVLAIEPSIENFIKLKQNLSEKSLNNWVIVECLNLALAEKGNVIKELRIFSAGNSGQRSIAFDNYGAQSKKEFISQLCKTISIDDIFNNNKFKHGVIDYFKIDIEGGEYEALPLTDKTKEYFSRVKFIDIEFHPCKPPFFDRNVIYEKLNHIDKHKDIIKQYLEFYYDCGFMCAIKNYENGYKLCTYNINI